MFQLRWLYGMLILSVLTIVLSFFPVPAFLLFVVACLGLIPLASLVGQSVERIAEHTGETLGVFSLQLLAMPPNLSLAFLLSWRG